MSRQLHYASLVALMLWSVPRATLGGPQVTHSDVETVCRSVRTLMPGSVDYAAGMVRRLEAGEWATATFYESYATYSKPKQAGVPLRSGMLGALVKDLCHAATVDHRQAGRWLELATRVMLVSASVPLPRTVRVAGEDRAQEPGWRMAFLAIGPVAVGLQGWQRAARDVRLGRRLRGTQTSLDRTRAALVAFHEVIRRALKSEVNDDAQVTADTQAKLRALRTRLRQLLAAVTRMPDHLGRAPKDLA
jgi:hypothetical protein